MALICALIVTILPFFGWNEYTLEVCFRETHFFLLASSEIFVCFDKGARTSCCTNLYDRRPHFVSYNMFIFIIVYVIPLVILVGANSTIYVGLKRMQDKVAHGMKTELSNKRIEMERRILKSKCNMNDARKQDKAYLFVSLFKASS